ncbi:MAG: flavodoxin domain-containing protein [Candidatus Thorarchaeota archaeon]
MKSHKVHFEAGRPSKMIPKSHDRVVFDSAVYGGKVQDDILQFVSEKQSALSQSPLATFFVCKEANKPDCYLE